MRSGAKASLRFERKSKEEIIMPDVLVRNIDRDTLDRLKARAHSNNRSLQEELKELLEIHAKPDIESTRNRVNDILKKYEASGRRFSDSGSDLSKDRER